MGSRDRPAPEVDVIALWIPFARLDRRLGRTREGKGMTRLFSRAGVSILIVPANNRLNDRHARCSASGVTRQDGQAQA
jgi:hypothetical protein